MRTKPLLLGLSLTLVACPKEQPKSDTTPPSAASATSTGATTVTSAAPSASAAPSGPKPVFHTTGFQTPESVLYDDVNDRYLVSNINGKPTDADNNGYISVLGTDGKVVTEKWIEGGKNKVTLNAPKGLGIVNGVLYVADLDAVRSFDAKSGAPKGDVKIAGTTSLNDIAVNSIDGKVYVSDAGPATDAVYVIEKGKARPLAKDAEKLGRPNGLVVGPTGVWVVALGSGELYRLDDKGQKQDAIKLPKSSLDGVVMMGESLFISSWDANAVYEGRTTGPFNAVSTNVKSPADIGVDAKRKRILVPLFLENAVEAYEVR
jgi:sugar lactone lactonase YvrE